eukprot:GEMP01001449.1.p1 GENE.GEMP01001449.1~~GEMP01001449.1.p1  ORF type:complete len:1510 (+),score=364.19 GEMP01001449.1:106-4635(+)
MWVFQQTGLEGVARLPDEYFLRLGKGVKEIAPHLLEESTTHKPPPPASILRCPTGRFLHIQNSRVRTDYPVLHGICKRYLWTQIGAAKLALPDAFVATAVEPSRGFVRPAPTDNLPFDMDNAMTIKEFVESKISEEDSGVFQWFCPTIIISYRRKTAVATLNKRALKLCPEYIDTLVLGAMFEMKIRSVPTLSPSRGSRQDQRKLSIETINLKNPIWTDAQWVQIPGEGFVIQYRQHGGPVIDTDKIMFKKLQDVCAYFERWRTNRLSKMPKTWIILWATTQPCRQPLKTCSPVVPVSLEQAMCALGHPLQQFWSAEPHRTITCRSCGAVAESAFTTMCVYGDQCSAYQKGDQCAACGKETMEERKHVTDANLDFRATNARIRGEALSDEQSELAITCQLYCRNPRPVELAFGPEHVSRVELQFGGEICSALQVPPEQVIIRSMEPAVLEGNLCTAVEFALLHPQIAKARLEAMIMNQKRTKNLGRTADVDDTFKVSEVLLQFSACMKGDGDADSTNKMDPSKNAEENASDGNYGMLRSETTAIIKGGDEGETSKESPTALSAIQKSRTLPTALAEHLLSMLAGTVDSDIRSRPKCYSYLATCTNALKVKTLFGFPDTKVPWFQSECRLKLASDGKGSDVHLAREWHKDFQGQLQGTDMGPLLKHSDARGLVAAMRKFPTRHVIQLKCLELLSAVADDPSCEGGKEVRLNGGLTNAKLAWSQFINLAPLTAESLLLFGNLCRYDIAGLNAEVMGDLGVLPITLESLVNFPMEEKVHANGCRVIGLLYTAAVANPKLFMRRAQDGSNSASSFESSHVTQLRESGGLAKVLIQMVVKSAKLFPDSASVQEACMTCFARSLKSRLDLDIMKTLGGVQIIITAMTKFPHHEVLQRSSCVSLNVLSAKDNLLYLLENSNGIMTLVEAMRNHPMSHEVQLNGCQALANFTQSLPGPEMVVKAQGIKFIALAMNRHRSNRRLQETGCRAIHDLSKSASSLVIEEFMATGAVSCLIFAMVAHKHDIGVQSEGMRALKHMVPISAKVLHGLGSMKDLVPEFSWLKREEVGEGVAEKPIEVDDPSTYSGPGSGSLEELDAFDDLRPMSAMRKPGMITLQTLVNESGMQTLVKYLDQEESDAVLTALALIAMHSENLAQMVIAAGATERIEQLAIKADTLATQTAAITVLQSLCRYEQFAHSFGMKSGLISALCVSARDPAYPPLRRVSLGVLANLCCFQDVWRNATRTINKTNCIQESLADSEITIRVNAAFVSYWMLKYSTSEKKMELYENEWLFDIVTALQTFVDLDKASDSDAMAPPSVSKGSFIACMALREILGEPTIANREADPRNSIGGSTEVIDAFRSIVRRRTTMSPSVASAAIAALRAWGLCGQESLHAISTMIEPILSLYTYVPKKTELSIQCKKFLKQLILKMDSFALLEIIFAFSDTDSDRHTVVCPDNILKYAAKKALEMAQKNASDVSDTLASFFRNRMPSLKDTSKHAGELRDSLRNLVEIMIH